MVIDAVEDTERVEQVAVVRLPHVLFMCSAVSCASGRGLATWALTSPLPLLPYVGLLHQTAKTVLEK